MPDKPSDDIVNDQTLREMIIGGDITDNPEGTILQGEVEDSYRRESLEQGLVQPGSEEEVTEDAVQGEEEVVEEAEEVVETVSDDEAGEETVPAGGAEEAEIKRRQLEDEELDKMFVVGKVNGQEKEFSLRDLLATQQTQAAASERLDLAKDMQRQYHDLIQQYQQQLQQATQPAAPQPDEFSTPEDRQLAEMRQELSAMRAEISNTETQRLSAAEDDMIRQRIETHLGTEDMNAVAGLIQRVKAEDPVYGSQADALFDGLPTSQAHMNQRVAFMDSLLIKAKSLEMPTIIEKAKEEGKKELKREKKSQLASVDTTQKVPEETRAEKLAKAAQKGERGVVNLFKGEIIERMFPDV